MVDELADLNATLARRRTLRQATADIIRECRGQATYYEARQALQDAINVIDQSANWEFLIATRLINLHAPQSSGTVSINSGTFTVTLSGSTWPTTVSPFGEYREIKFADRGMPYKVASATSTTTIDLKTNLAGTAFNHIVNGKYVLYQARYPLPVDCEPGRDLVLRAADSRGSVIPKRERWIYENTTSTSRGANLPEFYTDDEYDDANGSGTIRIEPYPSTAEEIQLTYYRKLVVPDANDDLLNLPEAFERAPVLAAASNILRKKNIAGWQQMRQEAGDMLNKMYNRYASSPAYEGKINPDMSDIWDDPDQIWGGDGVMWTRGNI